MFQEAGIFKLPSWLLPKKKSSETQELSNGSGFFGWLGNLVHPFAQGGGAITGQDQRIDTVSALIVKPFINHLANRLDNVRERLDQARQQVSNAKEGAEGLRDAYEAALAAIRARLQQGAYNNPTTRGFDAQSQRAAASGSADQAQALHALGTVRGELSNYPVQQVIGVGDILVKESLGGTIISAFAGPRPPQAPTPPTAAEVAAGERQLKYAPYRVLLQPFGSGIGNPLLANQIIDTIERVIDPLLGGDYETAAINGTHQGVDAAEQALLLLVPGGGIVRLGPAAAAGSEALAGAAEASGVRIATGGAPIVGQGTSPLLGEIRGAGGTLAVTRGQVGVQDIAAASRASGNEIAYFRDRATGQLFVRELGPIGGEIPTDSRLILHSQPGSGPLAVQPSGFDRAALDMLGQRSSVIINSEGTYSLRFRPTNLGDGQIRPIGGQ